MAANVTFSGFKEFSAKCNNMTADILEEMDLEIEEAARNWEGLAKDAAPVDMGILRGLISHTPVVEHSAEVISGANYSAYIEWGTKRRVVVPANLQAYASQFRGKGSGGDYFDFLNAILDWVIRKGIAARFSIKTKKAIRIKLGSGSDDEQRLEQVATAIALSIIRHGIKPHPFFFIQSPIVEAEFFKHCQNILNTEH